MTMHLRLLAAALVILLAACQQKQPEPKPATLDSALAEILGASTADAAMPVPTLRQPTKVSVSGPYRHKLTGFIYPEAIADFTRKTVVQYDDDGMDVSATYLGSLPSGKVVASIYVYPITSMAPDIHPAYVDAEDTCRQVFEGSKKSALQLYANPFVRETGATPARFGSTQSGYRVIFDADKRYDIPADDVFTDADGPLTSELYLYCAIDKYWHVKYRFTYPRSVDARTAVNDFMAKVPAR
jgi:outer membrane lipoprotein-sorting protein